MLFEFVLRRGDLCMCVDCTSGLRRQTLFSCEGVVVGCVGSLVGVFVEVLLF